MTWFCHKISKGLKQSIFLQIVKAKEGQQSLFYEKVHWYANVVCISYSTQCDLIDSKSKSPTQKCAEIELVISETSQEEVCLTSKFSIDQKSFENSLR